MANQAGSLRIALRSSDSSAFSILLSSAMLKFLLELDQRIASFINGSDSLYWDDIVYLATQTLTWIPVGLVLLFVVYREKGLRSLLLILGLILLGILISDQLSSSIVKPLTHRFRPAQDPYIMYFVDVVNEYRGGSYGFFSAHASNTFTVATLLSLVFRHRLVALLLYSWALLNCYTRIYLGVHYFGDITVGIIVGLLVGWGMYRLYVYFEQRTLRPRPGSDGLSHVYSEPLMQLLMASILFTYCLLFIVPLFFI